MRLALPPTSDKPVRPRGLAAVSAAAMLATAITGCAHLENHWREDSPAKTQRWESDTAADILARYGSQTLRGRGWGEITLATGHGGVTHWPTAFEDPFVDKGAGNARFDEFGTGENAYRIGWADFIAMPYGFARHTLNWLLFPVSTIVTPPWVLMESDGRVSRQALAFDHDAARVGAARPADAESPPDSGPR